MTGRVYPEEVAGPFPSPPEQFEDGDGRGIDVRVFDGTEIEPVVEMYVDFDPQDRAQGIPPSGEERVRGWLENLVDDGLNLVAWHDDRAVGHAVLMPEREGEAWELAIFVHQDYQGAGVGSVLIECLLGRGADDGVERVWLTVERWNRPAVGLYEKVGFEPSGSESFEMEMSLRLA